MKEQRPFSQPFSQMTQASSVVPLSSALAVGSTGLSCGAGGGRDPTRADTPAIALLPRPRPCWHSPAVTHVPWQAVSHSPLSLSPLLPWLPPTLSPSFAGRQAVSSVATPLPPRALLLPFPTAITPFPWRAVTLPHHSSVLLDYSLLYRCHPGRASLGRGASPVRWSPRRPSLLCSLFWRARPLPRRASQLAVRVT